MLTVGIEQQQRYGSTLIMQLIQAPHPLVTSIKRPPDRALHERDGRALDSSSKLRTAKDELGLDRTLATQRQFWPARLDKMADGIAKG